MWAWRSGVMGVHCELVVAVVVPSIWTAVVAVVVAAVARRVKVRMVGLGCLFVATMVLVFVVLPLDCSAVDEIGVAS